MTDMLEKGASWLDNQRHQHMTRTVSYARGASTVEVQTTIGRTIFEQADEFGIVTKTESRDYLIRTADLVLDGQGTLPKRGDQIRETDGTTTFVYEVLSPGDEPVFRYSDPYRKALRIHTKHIATEPTP
ncbi:MAG TPA: hypothetical protein ENJ00_05895 [Phycisphaerales bacterium]|nr:hypothetical protein [Phycisphaerales bacterium]